MKDKFNVELHQLAYSSKSTILCLIDKSHKTKCVFDWKSSPQPFLLPSLVFNMHTQKISSKTAFADWAVNNFYFVGLQRS